MEQQNKAIEVGAPRRRPGRSTLRACVAAVSIVGMNGVCMAADSISSLGSSFRPQSAGDVPAASSGERSGATLPGLRVIVTSPSRAVASIDGQVVHVGDTVNGMRVTQINQQGVVMVGEGGVQERLMINPVVKRMRPADTARASNGARQ